MLNVAHHMWDNDKGGAGHSNPKIDCRNGGNHRFGALHFLKQRNITIRTCRYCAAERITQYDVIDGKLVETPLKISNQQNNDKTY